MREHVSGKLLNDLDISMRGVGRGKPRFSDDGYEPKPSRDENFHRSGMAEENGEICNIERSTPRWTLEIDDIARKMPDMDIVMLHDIDDKPKQNKRASEKNDWKCSYCDFTSACDQYEEGM